MPASFCAVGDVMIDVVAGAAPAFPELHDGVRLRVGGAAASAAVAAAAAGAEASVVGRVGDDEAATMLEEALRRRGVRPCLRRDLDAATGIVVVTPAGVVADRGANAGLAAADVPDPISADAVLVSGWALLQPDTAHAAETALARAQADWLAVDPASARLLALLGADRFYAVTAPASAVLVNAAEAEALTGERDPDRATEALAQRYRLVCVKLGAEGAVANLRGRRERVVPHRRRSGEIFGAGDAFAGALLAALALEADLLDALRQACEMGAAAADGVLAVGPTRRPIDGAGSSGEEALA